MTFWELCGESSSFWQDIGINERQEKWLNEYIKQKEEKNEDGAYLDVQESYINLIKSEVLSELFKDYIFVGVPYKYKVPKGKKHLYSIPGGLYETIAIDTNGSNTYVFFGHGNYEEFANFLHGHRIKLNTTEDAKKIWKAFCDIHKKGWQGDFIQIDKNKWKLARQVYDFRAISSYEEIKEEYYYLLELAEDKTVVSGRLHSDVVEKRNIK